MTMTTQTIPPGWTITTLGKTIFPVSETYAFSGKTKVHFLNTGDILEGKLLHRELCDISSLPGQAKKSFHLGDILYSEIRPENKRYMLVDFDASSSVASTKLMVLRTKDIVDKLFIYKILTSQDAIKEFQFIAESRSGTFPQVTFDAISLFPILLPPLSEQKAIAAVLSVLDDKIELLRKNNKTLENIAQTLFKRWFVEYEFPNEKGKPYKSSSGKMTDSELGEIPEGWGVKTVSKFGQIVCGKTPSKSAAEYFGGDIPFIKIPDMHNQLFIARTDDSLTSEGAETQHNKFIPAGAICVSCIATVGIVSITSKKSQTNQQINSIIPSAKYYLEYLYFSLRNMKDDLITIGGGGSATLNVNTSVFAGMEIIFPDEDTLKGFHLVSDPIFDKILYNTLQIQTLSHVRDSLLPKLMKGELRVKMFCKGDS